MKAGRWIRTTMRRKLFIFSAPKTAGCVKGMRLRNLVIPITLEAGMTLHFPPLEWHVFEFKPGGHVDIIFFYGQVDQIRPEEMK